MNSKKTVAFFPISAETIDQARAYIEYHQTTIQRYIYLTYKGSGLLNHDVSFAKNETPSNVDVMGTDDISFEYVDSLVLLNADNIFNYNEFQFLVNNALLHKCTIIDCIATWNKNYCYYDMILKPKSIYTTEDQQMVDFLSQMPQKTYDEHKRIPATIIAIGGIVEEADVFKVFSKIVCELRKRNIQTLAIGKFPICTQIGMHCYPDCFMAKGLSEEEKIIIMNWYVDYLVKTEHPQIVVLQLPGPAMRLDKRIPFGYGVKSFMLAQSVDLSGLICCMPDGYHTPEIKHNLDNIVRILLGCSIISQHHSNFALNYQSMSNRDKFAGYYRPYSPNPGDLTLPHNLIRVVNRIIENLSPNIQSEKLAARSHIEQCLDCFI